MPTQAPMDGFTASFAEHFLRSSPETVESIHYDQRPNNLTEIAASLRSSQ